jgi:hypothetical protein
MIEFGGPRLVALPLSALRINADTRSLREQLGRRIGISENTTDPGPWSLRSAFEANLGHAALLCLQAQDEIANQNQLFHRQGEPGVDQALRDTLPYFLGAVPQTQAVRRAQLRDARRRLSRASAELQAAKTAAETVDVELETLANEARVVGLANIPENLPRDDLIAELRLARQAEAEAEPPLADTAAQERRIQLESEMAEVRAELRRLMADRRLLLEDRSAEGPFSAALHQHAGRLTSLDLLNVADEQKADDQKHSDACPVCGQELAEPDPTTAQLSASLASISAQLEDLAAAAPRRQQALTDLDSRAASLRARLEAGEAALEALMAAETATHESRSRAAARDFTKGRIDATLARAAWADDVELARLRLQVSDLSREVEALEAELDVDDEREQLTSRLISISRDMTRFANQLQLEHASESVRLDLARLTVVTDTPGGPTPLYQIGSAANWIGYHLTTHLALHSFFVTQGRPVPRFLMLDQPSQAYYPSEASQRSGIPESDTDRQAVLAMFALLRDVVARLAPEMQIIVSDHANLSDVWFAEAVTHNWRDGAKLIPASWLK